MTETDDQTFVRGLIAASGIEPLEAEIEEAIAGFPQLRASLDRLYRVAIDHEEDLVVTFAAE